MMAYAFYFESKFRAWSRDAKYLKFQLPDGTEFMLSEEWIVASQGNKRTGMQRLIFLKRNNYASSYRVTVEVSSASNKATGEIVLTRELKPQRTSIIILLSDFQKLRYPVQQKVFLEDVEISERLLHDTFKYKVTVIPLDESQSETEIASKRDKILIMSDQLNSLLNTGDFADIIITDKENRCTIKAHRNILAARSVYFRCMFQNNWLENKNNIIIFSLRLDESQKDSSSEEKIKRIDKKMGAIKEMLHYIYTGVVRPMKISDMICLYMISDEFLLDDLKKFLSEELRKRLNTENAVAIYVCAGYVLDRNLQNSCLISIQNNFQKISNTQFWRTLENNENILDCRKTLNTISEIINRIDN